MATIETLERIDRQRQVRNLNRYCRHHHLQLWLREKPLSQQVECQSSKQDSISQKIFNLRDQEAPLTRNNVEWEKTQMWK